MVDEYLEPRESNFDLKIIIDENELITLYSNVSPNGVEWEETKMQDFILPKKEFDLPGEDQVYPMAYGTPEIKKETNLGAELPIIVYESKEQVIFYNYMGIFVYDLNHSKMSHAIKLLDQEFTETQGDKSTIVNYDQKEKILNIYRVGVEIPNYFYKFHLTSDRLEQHMGEFVEGQEQHEVTGRMDTSDWTAGDLKYTSSLTGETYYPFSIIIN